MPPKGAWFRLLATHTAKSAGISAYHGGKRPPMNPANLALRFFLELAALGALAWWGWAQTDSWWRAPLAIGVVLLAAIVWGTFAVPDDPSRGGSGLVHIPGIARLGLELLIFGGAAYALRELGRPNLAAVFAFVVVAHYAWSYERVAWLMRQ
jgi:hypothetical protein